LIIQTKKSIYNVFSYLSMLRKIKKCRPGPEKNKKCRPGPGPEPEKKMFRPGPGPGIPAAPYV
jgi:hypothetical protein